MNVSIFKEKLLTNIEVWLKGRLDEIVKTNSMFTIPSVYIKRGCHNLLTKYKDNLGTQIDKISLFFADENGEINLSTLFSDGIEILKSTENSVFDLGFLKGKIDKGDVSIAFPDNVLTNLILGNKKTLIFREEDFLELKDLMLKE